MPLVALVGMPDLHPQISHYLRVEQPSLSSLSVPDYGGVVALQGKDRRPFDARMPPPLGIVKAGWLSKHRHRCPAVIAIFFETERVFGDGTQWMSVCSQFDSIRASLSRGRPTKLVVCIVQHVPGVVNEERAIALKKRGDLDPRCCMLFVTHDQVDLKRSLSRFASVVSDLARQYYGEEGRRIKTRLERKTYSSPELTVRYNFKVAVYCEFRRDWMAAVKYYTNAYSALMEVMGAPLDLQPVQRMMELKMVAELLNMKACTLLLHLGNSEEALKQFRRHIVAFQHLIGEGGEFLHWAWVARQFRLFGEILQQRFSQALQPGFAVNPTDREIQPAYYFKIAARYTSKRRKAYEDALILESFAVEEEEDVLDGSPDKIGLPLYVGQPPRILSRGTTPDLQRPTEAEYVRHMLQLEKKVPHTMEVIELLTKAREQYKRLHGQRTMHEIVFEIGREYYYAEDYLSAKQAFDSVIVLYRKEGWVLLLAASLAHLRECARHLGLRQEFMEYSLEFASLPLPKGHDDDGDEEFDALAVVNARFEQSHCLSVYREVMGMLQGSRTIKGLEGGQEWAVDENHPADFAMGEASPLCVVMAAVATFHQRTVRPHAKARLTIAVLTYLPEDLNLTEVEVVFGDPLFGCTLLAGEKPEGDESDEDQGDGDARMLDKPKADRRWGYDLTLRPREWKHLTLEVDVGEAGRVECVAIIARITPHTTLSCQVDMLGSEVPSIWTFEPGGNKPPFKDTDEGSLGQRWVEVEEPEVRVAVEIDCSGVGVVGEALPVRVGVRSRGDRVKAGTLQLQLSPIVGVDDGGANEAGTGSASGRLDREKGTSGSVQLSPVSVKEAVDLDGMVPAELFVIPSQLLEDDGPSENGGQEEEEGQEEENDEEGCFVPVVGAIHVPGVAPDCVWSTVVFIRWRAAMGVSLTAMLEYELEDDMGCWMRGSDMSPTRALRVKKAVEIKCEEPFITSARFVGLYRQEALIPGVVMSSGGGIAGMGRPLSALPLDMKSSLIVTTRGESSLGIRVVSIAIDPDESGGCEVSLRGAGASGTTGDGLRVGRIGKLGSESSDEDADASAHPGVVIEVGAILQKEETLTEVFDVRPTIPGSMVRVGTLRVTWEPDGADNVWAFERCFDHSTTRKGSTDSPFAAGFSNLPLVGERVAEAKSAEKEKVPTGLPMHASDGGESPQQQGGGNELSYLEKLRRVWQRFGRVVTTRVELPSMYVEDPPVLAMMSAPPHGLLGVPFCLSLTIINRTTALQDVSFSVVVGQSFVFSGAQRGTMSVLPMSSCRLKYCVVAVASGMLQLPAIRVTVQRYGASLYHTTESLKLYVYPAPPRIKSAKEGEWEGQPKERGSLQDGRDHVTGEAGKGTASPADGVFSRGMTSKLGMPGTHYVAARHFMQGSTGDRWGTRRLPLKQHLQDVESKQLERIDQYEELHGGAPPMDVGDAAGGEGALGAGGEEVAGHGVDDVVDVDDVAAQEHVQAPYTQWPGKAVVGESSGKRKERDAEGSAGARKRMRQPALKDVYASQWLVEHRKRFLRFVYSQQLPFNIFRSDASKEYKRHFADLPGPLKVLWSSENEIAAIKTVRQSTDGVATDLKDVREPFYVRGVTILSDGSLEITGPGCNRCRLIWRELRVLLSATTQLTFRKVQERCQMMTEPAHTAAYLLWPSCRDMRYFSVVVDSYRGRRTATMHGSLTRPRMPARRMDLDGPPSGGMEGGGVRSGTKAVRAEGIWAALGVGIAGKSPCPFSDLGSLGTPSVSGESLFRGGTSAMGCILGQIGEVLPGCFTPGMRHELGLSPLRGRDGEVEEVEAGHETTPPRDGPPSGGMEGGGVRGGTKAVRAEGIRAALGVGIAGATKASLTSIPTQPQDGEESKDDGDDDSNKVSHNADPDASKGDERAMRAAATRARRSVMAMVETRAMTTGETKAMTTAGRQERR
ncbi:hypothetical protein CBR_g24120 [Chara braunii]|uniref:Trafficking protein particle complex subunit 11 domain-containing protein n=1 Tax=Chara braunii TaxID=69332 RepID=A0A388L5V9_CHABU|nr:hypothetical protein CBR_g24120 [Chara braunii]|eukprot:GBG77674.1 hypothetical protein CBR_g24120 [Chara braunii]